MATWEDPDDRIQHALLVLRASRMEGTRHDTLTCTGTGRSPDRELDTAVGRRHIRLGHSRLCSERLDRRRYRTRSGRAVDHIAVRAVGGSWPHRYSGPLPANW